MTSTAGIITIIILSILFLSAYLTYDSNRILDRIDKKSNEIILNARNNTEILCNFIVAHDLRDANQNGTQDIERVCSQEIERLREAQTLGNPQERD